MKSNFYIMSFKSCDPGIVFELGLSESSARECIRSLPLFVCKSKYVCVCVCWGRRLGFIVPQVQKLQAFWDEYSDAKKK